MKIAILVSAIAEWEGVKLLFPGAKINRTPFGASAQVKLDAWRPTLFHTGWGKIASAASIQYVMDRHAPDLIVNLGTCGGFEGVVERGDLILAERTFVYDIVELMGDPDIETYYASSLDLNWLGGFLSFYFSRRITLPDQVPPPLEDGEPTSKGLRNVLELLKANPAFLSFSSKRFVYFSAIMLSTPIMPLFLVREVRATDGQIGAINMVMTLVMLAGYFAWPRVSIKRSGRFVLLATTFGMALYPALSAATPRVELIILYAGIAGFFQGGLDLVFFDELMKTVPPEYSATFVSISQSMQYLSMVLAPLLGTWLAGYIGLGGALWVSAGLRLLGFILFLRRDTPKQA